MIPMMNIIAWSAVVPRAAQRQVEQDLIISRAIVGVFEDPLASRHSSTNLTSHAPSIRRRR